MSIVLTSQDMPCLFHINSLCITNLFLFIKIKVFQQHVILVIVLELYRNKFVGFIKQEELDYLNIGFIMIEKIVVIVFLNGHTRKKDG